MSQAIYGSTAANEAGDGLSKVNWCPPALANVYYGKWRSHLDNWDYYVWTSLMYEGGGNAGSINEHMHLFALAVNETYGNSSKYFSDLIDTDLGNLFSDSNPSCNKTPSGETQFPMETITSPLIFDMDYSPSNGMEAAIAYSLSNNEQFNMRIYRNGGSLITTFPVYTNADGRIISNPFRASVFDWGKSSTTQQSEVCVLGYDSTSNEMDMLCGSLYARPFSVSIVNNVEYFYTPPYNLSHYSNLYIAGAHAVQMSAMLSGNLWDLNEILTPYGVFTPIYTGVGCNILTGLCNLDRNWEMPVQDAAVIPIDVEKTQSQYEDILALTTSALWYIDDRYSNTPPQFTTAITVNPCALDSPIRVNTTLQVSTGIYDADGDDIQARGILYYGTGYDIDTNWTANTTTNTPTRTITVPLPLFTANYTGSNVILRLMVRDGQHASTPTVRDLTLIGILPDSGFTYGDCVSTLSITAANATAANNTIPPILLKPDVNDNPVRTGLGAVDEYTHLGLGTLWLILMALVAYLTWTSTPHENEAATKGAMGVIAIIEFILLIIGTWLGFLSAAILITIVTMGILVIALWTRTKTTGG
jgi:hypothetical protein